MKKYLFLSLLFLISMSLSAQEDLWASRSSPAGAQKAYESAKAQYAQTKDFDSGWKLARAASYYADHFVKDQERKKQIFNEGVQAAIAASKANPKRPEGWYYYGVCLGQWSETNGILDSLGNAGNILFAATQAIEADSNFLFGSPYTLRGRVYQKAPGLISVGDEAKAEADFKVAMVKGPQNRTARRFYGELLKDKGRKNEALALVDQALAIPPNQADPFGDSLEIGRLKELKDQLK